MIRRFVLREQSHADNLIAMVRSNWQVMAATEQPLSVVCAPFKTTRSLEANALMWIWLKVIEQQAWLGGRQYSDEVWHEFYKREFLPEINSRGDDKWREVPPRLPAAQLAPARVCVMSTTRLNKTEMSVYMTQIEAHAATELGVRVQ